MLICSQKLLHKPSLDPPLSSEVFTLDIMDWVIPWLSLIKESLHGVPVPGLQGAIAIMLEVALTFDVRISMPSSQDLSQIKRFALF